MLAATLSEYLASNLLFRHRTRISNTLNQPSMEKKQAELTFTSSIAANLLCSRCSIF